MTLRNQRGVLIPGRQAKPAQHLIAKPRAVGRPTNCCPELADKVAVRILLGQQFLNAYRAEGVSKVNVSDWMEKGEKDLNDGKDTVYAYWFYTVDWAKAEAIGRAESKVYQGGKEWQSSARWLESADRLNWQRSSMLSGDVDKPLVFNINVKSKQGKDMVAKVLNGERT